MTLSLNDVPLTPSSSLALVFFPNKHVAVQRTAHIYLSHVIFFIFLLLSLSSDSFPLYISFLLFVFLFQEYSKKRLYARFCAAAAAILLCWHILMSLGDSKRPNQPTKTLGINKEKWQTAKRIPKAKIWAHSGAPSNNNISNARARKKWISYGYGEKMRALFDQIT